MLHSTGKSLHLSIQMACIHLGNENRHHPFLQLGFTNTQWETLINRLIQNWNLLSSCRPRPKLGVTRANKDVDLDNKGKGFEQ